MKRQSERGSLIIASLLLFSILLVLGLGLMSSQSARMKAAHAQAEAVQARQLALAAWQDVRVKLGTDILFPPRGVRESFSYSEDVKNSQGRFVGTYTVMIDVREGDAFRASSGELVQGFYAITCIGKVGDRGFEPRAERIIRYELDMDRFTVIRVVDEGSL